LFGPFIFDAPVPLPNSTNGISSIQRFLNSTMISSANRAAVSKPARAFSAAAGASSPSLRNPAVFKKAGEPFFRASLYSPHRLFTFKNNTFSGIPYLTKM